MDGPRPGGRLSGRGQRVRLLQRDKPLQRSRPTEAEDVSMLLTQRHPLGHQYRLLTKARSSSGWRPENPNGKSRSRGNQSCAGCSIRTLRSVGRSCATSPASPRGRRRASGRGLPSEGWGARLLDQQRPDGNWGDGIATPHWRSNLYTLVLLRDLGLDPTSERARTAVGLVRDKVTWGPEFGDSPFFEGEVEPCINGRVLALGGYFGETSDRLRRSAPRRAAHGRRLELRGGAGLRALLVPHHDLRSGRTAGVREGERRHGRGDGRAGPGTGVSPGASHVPEVVIRRGDRSATWTRFSFPTTWHYDVLRGLDYLRSAGVEPDERVAEAVGLVAKRRHQDGRWPLDDPHPDPVHFDMEGGAGKPSRWNTLRALRVLDWYSAQG